MAGATSSDDEDFAAEPVPASVRANWPGIFFAAVGMATALIYMQVTSIVTLEFGSSIAFLAIAYATIVSSFIAYLISSTSILTGMGTNLLARMVLGYRGAALFSLIFGFTTLIFFVAEATIMGAALRGALGSENNQTIQIAIAALMVPLVWFGMKLLVRFQFATFILYGVLLSIALWTSFSSAPYSGSWLSFTPKNAPGLGTSLISAIAIMNGLVFITALVSADFARFVRTDQTAIGSLFVGIGFQAFCFTLAGILGVWFSVRYQESNPGVYFVTMLGAWGTVFAVATQLRINLSNMYLGSLAFVNLIAQAFNKVISRHVIVVLFGLAASILLAFSFASYLEAALNLIGMFTTCFTVLAVLKLLEIRRLKNFALENLTCREGDLPDFRWQAVISLVTATMVGSALLLGAGGEIGILLASVIAGLCQIVFYFLLQKLEK